MEIAAGEYGYDSLTSGRCSSAEAVDVLQLDATRCKGFTGFLEEQPLQQVSDAPSPRIVRLHFICTSAAQFRIFATSNTFMIMLASKRCSLTVLLHPRWRAEAGSVPTGHGTYFQESRCGAVRHVEKHMIYDLSQPIFNNVPQWPKVPDSS